MTTLNTIIEEEKGRFETVFGETLGLDEPFNNSYVLLHVKPMLKNFLTTAMQRASEERDTYWKERVREEIEEMASKTVWNAEGKPHISAPDMLQALNNLK